VISDVPIVVMTVIANKRDPAKSHGDVTTLTSSRRPSQPSGDTGVPLNRQVRDDQLS